MDSSRKVYHNILDLIGNTPLIKLQRIRVKPGVEIWAKLEGANPGGSVKDRIALSMIEDAEKKGLLTREKIVAEASSGNTGIGLAMVCAVKGYRCLIAMPESASIERRKLMQAYGAEILLTPAEKGTDGAIEAIYELVRAHPERYFNPDQFNNPANWQMHYRTTGPEIWRDTEGRVTHVVASMGTTGTLMGLARYFREKAPRVKVIGVEPLPGRLKMRSIKGVKVIDDTYNASPESVKVAIEVLCETDADRRVACLGEMRELGRESERLHREVGELVARSGVDLLVAVGEGGEWIAEGAKRAGMAEERVRVLPSPEEAGRFLASWAEAGDLILFKASRAVGMERALEVFESAL